MCRNQDRGTGLHDLVGILWCSQGFEGTCRRIECENRSGVAVLRRPFGSDQERVTSSWRKPEWKHRLRQAHSVVIADRHQLGALIVGRPYAAACHRHAEPIARF
jgi:hypothetical protein